jgi:hypothetical protein
MDRNHIRIIVASIFLPIILLSFLLREDEYIKWGTKYKIYKYQVKKVKGEHKQIRFPITLDVRKIKVDSNFYKIECSCFFIKKQKYNYFGMNKNEYINYVDALFNNCEVNIRLARKELLNSFNGKKITRNEYENKIQPIIDTSLVFIPHAEYLFYKDSLNIKIKKLLEQSKNYEESKVNIGVWIVD